MRNIVINVPPLREAAEEVRIEWRLPDGTCGAGLWHPASLQSMANMQGHVTALCDLYGAGTHWVAVRAKAT